MLRILTLAFLVLPLAAFARDWQVDAAKSSLTFKGTYQGQSFDGKLQEVRCERSLTTQPTRRKSKFDVTVDLASVDTASSERDDTLRGADFFDTAKIPAGAFRHRRRSPRPPTAASRRKAR